MDSQHSTPTLSRDERIGLVFLDLTSDLGPLTGLRFLVGDPARLGDRAGDSALEEDIFCKTSTSPFQ